jgi:hypothetical protein
MGDTPFNNTLGAGVRIAVWTFLGAALLLVAFGAAFAEGHPLWWIASLTSAIGAWLRALFLYLRVLRPMRHVGNE